MIPGDFTTIQNVINGNIDATNVSPTLAQSAAVNQSGQTVKGAASIATSESRTNVAYGTLTTPDQVTGIVLPANGLIQVWYQATWQESVAGAARAAIFLGANQLKIAVGDAASAAEQAATSSAATNGSPAAVNHPLASCALGVLSGAAAGGYTGDVTTGQAVGIFDQTYAIDHGGVVAAPVPSVSGGPCYIFAAAGTYTISVQFKASSGSVTASNRRLWVQAVSFA